MLDMYIIVRAPPICTNLTSGDTKPSLSLPPLRSVSRHGARPSRRLVDNVVLAGATALGRDGSRAGDLLESHGRVVGAAEPVEAPVAARLQRLREAVAVGPRMDAAVPVAPAVRGRAVLVGAGVELAYAATGDLLSELDKSSLNP